MHAWAIGAACLPLALAALVYRSRQAVARRRYGKLASGERVDSQAPAYAAPAPLCDGTQLRSRRTRLSALLIEALGDGGQSSSSILMMPLAELPEAALVHRIAAEQGYPSLGGIGSSTRSIAARDSRQAEIQKLGHQLLEKSQHMLHASSTAGGMQPPAASMAAGFSPERQWGLMTQSMALQPRELEVRARGIGIPHPTDTVLLYVSCGALNQVNADPNPLRSLTASSAWLQFITDAQGQMVVLGEGGAAVVYLAELQGVQVAVKVGELWVERTTSISATRHPSIQNKLH